MAYVRYMRGLGQTCYPADFSGPLPEGAVYCTDLNLLALTSGVPSALQAAVTPLAVAGAPNPFSNTSPSGMVSSSLPVWFIPLAVGLGVVLVIGAMNGTEELILLAHIMQLYL